MERHKFELLKKSGMDNEEFQNLLNLLLQKVMIVPSRTLQRYKKEAYEIIKNIDPDDVTFIACALAYPDSIIWSDDKKLKQQKKVPIITTSEVITHIYRKK